MRLFGELLICDGSVHNIPIHLVMSAGYDIPPPAGHSQFESRKTSGNMASTYEVRLFALENFNYKCNFELLAHFKYFQSSTHPFAWSFQKNLR